MIRMNLMLLLPLVMTIFLATRAHGGEPELTENIITKEGRNLKPQLFDPHPILYWTGLGRSDVNSALQVMGSIFNFVDIYGRAQYPVMDSNMEWFMWVDRNLPLVLGNGMAPNHLIPHDEENLDLDYSMFDPYGYKMTDTKSVIWTDFYLQMYMDLIDPNTVSPRSDGNSRQGNCLNGMYEGYSSIEVDVVGQVFKYIADNTISPVLEYFNGPDHLRSTRLTVDPLYSLTQHFGYFLGLSELEDSYSFYESRIDGEDRSISCFDGTARVMNAVMPYGPFLTLSNLAAVGVWIMAFFTPFLANF